MKSESEPDLETSVVAALAGDALAKQQILVAAYAELGEVLRGQDDAEDLRQLAIERVAEAWPRFIFDGAGSFLRWVRGVAWNVRGNYGRAEERRTEIYAELAECEPPEQAPLDRAVEAQRLLDSVARRIGQLVTPRRHAIAHHVGEAETPDKSADATRSDLRRGRDDLHATHGARMQSLLNK
ncbi:MAG: hypothetical protein HC927_03695 [Deltaproteobacteria bacterium]|nr:hypothetical protein [Deltaproteobacteria bacterium]